MSGLLSVPSASSARRRCRRAALALTALATAAAVQVPLAAPAAAAPVSSLAELQAALDTGCVAGSTVTLGDSLTATGEGVYASCDVTLDLAGHDLTVGHMAVDPDQTFTVTDSTPAPGPAGTLTADARSIPEIAGIWNAGATFVTSGRAQVVAYGGHEAAGIGDGTTIAEGFSTITATGGAGGAGIGGGAEAPGGTTTANDNSIITATGGSFAAGIGGGLWGRGGTTTANDTSTITATGGERGAGIGGGSDGYGGTTTSNDTSTITATGGERGAGIGGGDSSRGGTTVSNGSSAITATGGSQAAGIGGGHNGDGRTTTSNDTSTITAYAGDSAAGIGGGYDGDGGTTTSNDTSTITAIGGGSTPSMGTAIGHGGGGDDFGSLSIAGSSTLRLPGGSDLHVRNTNLKAGVAGVEMTVGPNATVTGSADATPTYGTISGGGDINNQGTITLTPDKIDVNEIYGHHYTVSYDTDGGTPAPAPMTVYAATVTQGNRALPTTPTKSGVVFNGWRISGSAFTATSTIPGSSTDGAPVELTAVAQWDEPGDTSTFPDPNLSVTGTPKVGSPLTAAITTPNVDGLTVAWQWQTLTPSGAVDIPGATNATYTPTADQVGRSLQVVVTLSAPGYATRTDRTTTPVVSTDVSPIAVAVTGNPRVGQPLTARADGDVTWQWQTLTATDARDIAGATGATYTPTADQVGVRLRVVATSATGTGAADTTAVQKGQLQLRGEIRGKKTLRAWIDKSVLPAGAKLSYQWRADGKAIKGATKQMLRITRARTGRDLTVVVRAQAPGYRPVRVELTRMLTT